MKFASSSSSYSSTSGAAVLVAAALLSAWPVQATPFFKRATICNGDSALCSRLYSNVTFIGSHDSYAVSSSSIAANQQLNVTQQLNDGVRLLQAQAHKSNGTSGGSGIDLCHTECSLLDGGSLENWLGSIKSWSDSNPSEVITVLLTNPEGLPPSSFATAYQSTGMTSKSYTPQSSSGSAGAVARESWPTLGSLIDASTPIVNFLAQQADTSSVAYLLPEFNNIWENPFNQVDVPPFNCSVDRIASGASPSEMMYLINHFKDLSFAGSTTLLYPDKANLSTTNSQDSIMTDADNCASSSAGAGRYPNFILLDFYETPAQGPFRAAAAMNGITYQPAATASNSQKTGSNSGSSSSSSGAASLALDFSMAKQLGVLAAIGAAASFVL